MEDIYVDLFISSPEQSCYTLLEPHGPRLDKLADVGRLMFHEARHFRPRDEFAPIHLR